ncbi:MAG TPA: FtsX-like permease family protein, partial [Microbacterium sp.]|nr:FtsX-like permease family protein [Microbacterium sp.]
MTAIAETGRMPRPAASVPRSASAPLAWLRERGMGASILVAAISSAFGAILLSATGYIAAVLRADPFIGESGMLAAVLAIMSFLLIGVAVYVAAIVTANTFATVIAGRTRRIALLRLIGASARTQRSEVARQGLVVGVVGAVLGLVGGTLVSWVGVALAGVAFGIGEVEYAVVQPVLVIPAVVVALTTWAAAWAGSRRVLTVTPLQALGGSVEASHDAFTGKRARNGAAVTLFAIGGALLAGGIAIGLVSPLGVVVAFFGGVFSFTGLALGATLVMPPVLRLVGKLFGSSATARLASENALRYPERSSRMAIGVVMG